MCRSDHIQQVLKILAKNANDNVRPELVKSVDIAGRLGVGLTEIKQLLKVMDGMGIVVCNTGVDYSLITKQGVKQLNC